MVMRKFSLDTHIILVYHFKESIKSHKMTVHTFSAFQTRKLDL